MEKILLALIKGQISPEEAEKQRLLLKTPKKRGRPKKSNNIELPKYHHVGRPKMLEAFYKKAAVNGLWLVLNYLAKDTPQITKREVIAEQLHTTRSTVDKAIAEFNMRINQGKVIYLYNPNDGMVFICNGSENPVRFISKSFLEKQARTKSYKKPLKTMFLNNSEK